MITNRTRIKEVISIVEENRLGTECKIKVSSTSKIKKITAIRKNCVENGSRAELIGSKPHSNGEGFSRSENSFLAREKLIKIKIKGMIMIRGIKLII